MSAATHPALVTAGRWGVSCTTGDGITGAVLNVYIAPPAHNPRGPFRYGDANGRTFPSVDAARAFAWERGYLQPHYSSLRARRKAEARRPVSP